MKFWQSIRNKNFRKIFCISLVLTLLGITFVGCGRGEVRDISLKDGDRQEAQEACTRANGKPFCIAVLDLDPPIESSYLWLKGLAEGLQDKGFIDASVDLASAPENFEEYYQYLLRQDLGEYVLFDETYYILGESNEQELAAELRRKVEADEIQLVAATGTDPGLFLKELNLGIPFTVSLASDPVESGIIDSAEDTGDENIWALVEPSPFYRQFGAYHNMLHFDKLGMVEVEEYDVIAGNAEYRKLAEELGVELVELSFTEEETMAKDYEQNLMGELKKMDFSELDGVLFVYGAVNDDIVGTVSEYLASQGVPMLIGDGDSLVKNGGLLCLSCFDYEGYGNYTARVIANVFRGQKAGEQPCIYMSSPHIVINMTTAQKTGFDTSMELLRAVDVVYR